MTEYIIVGAFALIMLGIAWASLVGKHHPACKPEGKITEGDK